MIFESLDAFLVSETIGRLRGHLTSPRVSPH